MPGPMNFNCDYGSRVVSFSSITTTDSWSRKPQSLPKIHTWAIQSTNDWLVNGIIILYNHLHKLISYAGSNALICDHGSRAISTTSIFTTEGQ